MIPLPFPTLDELKERAHVVSLPLRVRFRGITTREAMLFEGPAGWGEFSPFTEYAPNEARHWLASGIEMAFIGAPSPLRNRVEVNATIPAVDPGQVPELLARYPGCRTVKVKVAEHSLDEDLKRINAVRESNPAALIRVDANTRWSVDQAEQAAVMFGPLDYLEQPCATVEELAELRHRLRVKGIQQRVAADESIRKADDPYRVLDADAADVGIVKAAPLGGVRRLLEVAEHFRQQGLQLTVSSALDTAVGLGAGLAAAATLPDPAPAGLGTGSLFLEDVAAPRVIEDGYLSADPVVPDPARLHELAADPATTRWWFDRLEATYAALLQLRQR